MELDLQVFGERLRTARRARDLNQYQLAEQLGVPQSWISELENNKQKGLSADTVLRFARALGVSADYLLGLVDTPPATSPRRPRRRTDAGA